jgi:hypothetical protein
MITITAIIRRRRRRRREHPVQKPAVEGDHAVGHRMRHPCAPGHFS